MYPVCPNCGLSFEPETGFYYGAMYVSYGVTVAVSVLIFLISYWIWGWSVFPFLLIDTLVLVLLIPFVFRFSRSIYLSLIFYIDNYFRNKTR